MRERAARRRKVIGGPMFLRRLPDNFLDPTQKAFSMIVEQRTYTFHVGTVPQFMALYQEKGMKVQLSILGNMVGYFTSEFGELNQTVHLWGYDSLEDRQRRRATLMANAEWLSFFKQIQPLLVRQESKILLPTPFSPIA